MEKLLLIGANRVAAERSRKFMRDDETAHQRRGRVSNDMFLPIFTVTLSTSGHRLVVGTLNLPTGEATRSWPEWSWLALSP